VFVPYPVGNGEQRFNVEALVAAEGGLVVEDAKFDATWIGQTLIPLVSNTKQVAAMARKSRATGIVDASARLVRLAKGVLRR
jgi:UDP-N-acetylglucosamine--N-acetylmuramyl-(pentapeptide) pyrophosphoryl-undecaprenol N-acetylglucosamine transferase